MTVSTYLQFSKSTSIICHLQLLYFLAFPAPYACTLLRMDDNANKPMFEDISTEQDTDAYEQLRQTYLTQISKEMREMNQDATARQVAKNTRSKIVDTIPEALATMKALSIGAASESVRFNAAKWLLENSLLPGRAGEKDTMAELLEEMEELEKSQQEDA